MVEEDYECPRCDGSGEEVMTSEFGYWRFSFERTISKICERCDGSGHIEETRSARFDELSNTQIRALTEADIYRETGGEDEQPRPQPMTRGAAGRTPPTPNV